MYPSTMIRLNKNNLIQIELKNNIILYGTMVRSDMAMNIYMKDVEIRYNANSKINKNEHNITHANEMYVKGNTIKMVKLHTWTLSKQGLFN